jgi:hypothetical protein
MRRVLSILIVIFLFVATPTSAHILKTNGNIGVLLHLTPDDDPFVGEAASFYFEIKERENRFKTSDCICKVRILKGESEIFSSDLYLASSENNINSSLFSYTFKEKAIYTVIVTGQPAVENAFQPFQVEYDLRISRDRQNSDFSNSNLIVLAMIVFAIIVAATVYFRGHNLIKKS